MQSYAIFGGSFFELYYPMGVAISGCDLPVRIRRQLIGLLVVIFMVSRGKII